MLLKKKRLIFFITIMFLIIVFIFNWFKDEYSIKYKLNYENDSYTITEEKETIDGYKYPNYYFEITTEKSKFNFQIYGKFKGKKIIEKVYYYSDKKNECLLPIFKDKQQLIDMICISDKKYVYYNNIKGENSKLDKFVENIKDYDVNVYKADSLNKDETLVIDKKLPNNYYFVLENYKGIYIINSGKIKNTIKLFSRDVYKKTIKYFLDNYFIIADYNEKYEFHKFYLIDITTGKKEIIESNYEISMDSYIQGEVNNDLYLFDPSNKKQYKIDLKTKKIELINSKKVEIFENGNWVERNVYEAVNDKLLFNDYTVSDFDSKYDRSDLIGNYYYFYKKTKYGYKVYRDNIQNKGYSILITEIENLNRVSYSEDIIYYVDKGTFKYFNNMSGISTVLYSRELEFNEDLLVGLYIK